MCKTKLPTLEASRVFEGRSNDEPELGDTWNFQEVSGDFAGQRSGRAFDKGYNERKERLSMKLNSFLNCSKIHAILSLIWRGKEV